MPPKKARRLGGALAAALLALGPVSAPAQFLEMDGSAALEQISSYVLAGDTSAAIALLNDLQALGISEITIGADVIALAELETMVLDGLSEAELALFTQLLTVAQSGTATFGFSAQTETAASAGTSEDEDTFPVGSAG